MIIIITNTKRERERQRRKDTVRPKKKNPKVNPYQNKL